MMAAPSEEVAAEVLDVEEVDETAVALGS